MRNPYKARRGTSIAAAALSFALVAPAVQTAVVPQTGPAAHAETSGTVVATPPTDPTKLIEADGIANGYVTNRTGMTNAFATLSGLIGLKEVTASSSLKGTMGINDATIYMQFKDRDGTISPIFTTKSHQLGDTSGNYVFDLRARDGEGNVLSHPDSEVPGGEYSFVDVNGKPHLFRALRGQEYRIWVDSPLKNEETGNNLTYVRQAGGGVPGAWAPVTQGSANGAFYFLANNMQRTGIFLEERAPSAEANSYMVSPNFSMDNEGWHTPKGTKAPRYSYYGNVWKDAQGGPDRNETGPLYEWDGDQPIEGAKVYASVLSDEGIAEYKRLAIGDKPYREQAAATKSMIENMRANGKEPILKTVGAETNAEGGYTIRMGEDVGDRMNDYTYIWAEKDGKVLNSFSGFPTPVFQKVNGNSGENPNWGGNVGIPSFTGNRWYNINFAEVEAEIATLDIVNYDSYLNPADLPEGINNLEPAKIKLTGALPFSGDNKIVWNGPDGKQIGKDCPVNTLADAGKCALAPADFATPGTYVAQLVNAYGVVIAQDSFIAVDKVRQNGEFEPKYKDAEAKVGETTTVEAPKDKDGKQLPDGTSFHQITQLTDPNGKQIDTPDWVTVAPDGKIQVTPPEDAEVGEYTIPVLVTYPDGSRETITAKVTVKKPEAPAPKNPDWDDASTTPGTDVTVPKKDGSGDVPEGATVETEGPGTAEIQPDGGIKVTPSKDAKPGEKITVVVKDKDGKVIDTIKVEIKNPDAPAPAPSINTDGANSTVPANGGEHTVGKIDNPKGDETSKLVDKDGNEIPGSKVVIDEKTGEVKVTVPEGTDPQDAKVIITDGTGKDTIGEIDVKIVNPNYGDPTTVEAGKTESSKNPFGKDIKAPVEEAKGTPSKGSEDWEFGPKDGDVVKPGQDGVVTATAPSYDKVNEKISEKLPEIKSHEAGKRWAEFVKEFESFAKPKVEVEFTYNGGSKDKATAEFDLVGKDGKSLLDPEGDFDGDGKTNEQEIKDGTHPADSDNTPPTINKIEPGAKVIEGKGDRPGESITVTIPGKDGKVIEIPTTTDKNGNWKVDVPAGVDLKTGDTITATDAAGNKTEAKVSIDTGKCVASAVGFGLPLIALLPLGLASQIQIPVLSDVAGQVEAQLKTVNTRIQQQAGIFNPEMARQVEQINAQLRTFGADLGMVAAGIVLIAAGILAGTIINDNCNPNGPKSSVKDLELKGSSGKTTKLSSDKAGAKPSQKPAGAKKPADQN